MHQRKVSVLHVCRRKVSSETGVAVCCNCVAVCCKCVAVCCSWTRVEGKSHRRPSFDTRSPMRRSFDTSPTATHCNTIATHCNKGRSPKVSFVSPRKVVPLTGRSLRNLSETSQVSERPLRDLSVLPLTGRSLRGDLSVLSETSQRPSCQRHN